MTTASHYKEAEDTLSRVQGGAHVSPQDIATAQLHALVAAADELRAIRNELATMRGMVAALNIGT